MSIRRFREGLGLVPVSADPAGPVEGQLQFSDGTARTAGLWQYLSGSWQSIGGGGGGGLSAWVSGTAYTSSPASVVYYSDNKIYKCITANSDVVFTPAKWTALSKEATNLDELSDVAITSPVVYDTLVNDGTNFVNVPSTNYIKNGQALFSGTTGWAVTGGVSIARNTSSPLRGAADFVFTKPASNQLGNYWKYDFTIDAADRANPLKFSFDYAVSAGFSYANNDVNAVIYDVTNAVEIQCVSMTLDGSGRFVGEFQTAANSVSYSARIKVANSNTNSYTMNIAKVDVSATPAPSMLNLQDKQYDLTVTGISGDNGWSTLRAIGIPYKTKNGIWRLRVNIEGTSSAVSNITLTLTGVTFKNVSTLYQALALFPNTASGKGRARANPNAGTLYLEGGGDQPTQWGVSGDVELESQPTWAVDFYPVQLSDGAETRVVAAGYWVNANFSTTTSIPINFSNKSFDTHSAVTTSATAWKFTAPVSGIYQVDVVLMTASSGDGYLLTKNGTSVKYLAIGSGASNLPYYNGTALIQLNAGDYIDVRGDSTYTVNGSSTEANQNASYISIHRLSGPATIAASEKVYIDYGNASGQSITGTPATITSWTKAYDSHNAFNPTTGIFTAPRSGYYLIESQATIYWSSSAAQLVVLLIKKNNTNIRETDYSVTNNSSNNISFNINSGTWLNAGEDIRITMGSLLNNATLEADIKRTFLIITSL